MHTFIKIVMPLFCISCHSNAEKSEYETDLAKANVLRITNRLEVMIDKYGVHAESQKLTTDSVNGYIQYHTVYDQDGVVFLYYRSGPEGLISYSLHPREYHLLLEGAACQHECHIDKDKNYIIDVAKPKIDRFEYGTAPDICIDTIRDFVIISEDNIILSKDDYLMLQKAKKYKDSQHTRYILYRYQ